MNVQDPQFWLYLYCAAFLLLSCTHLALVPLWTDQERSNQNNLYVIYVLASLIACLLYAVMINNRQGLLQDTLGNAMIVSNYLLYLAAVQHHRIKPSSVALGVLCLVSALAGLLLGGDTLLWVHAGTIIVVLLFTATCFARRLQRYRNMGDAILLSATLVMPLGLIIAYWLLGHLQASKTWLFGLNCLTCMMVCTGLSTRALITARRNVSDLATKDPLTRMLNRHGLEESLSLSLASAARKNTSTTTLAIDIDHLRQINSAFGLSAGDQVLQQVSALIRTFSRASDVLAREDGDCFLLVLPDTSLIAGKKLAERIRSDIAASELKIQGQRLSVTVSIGVTSHVGYSELDDMGAQARQACQLAKRNGRNCVATLDNTVVRISGSAR